MSQEYLTPTLEEARPLTKMLAQSLHFGNMSDELARHNTRLFGDKVAPGLRTLFADVDDPWWPSGARAVDAEAAA